MTAKLYSLNAFSRLLRMGESRKAAVRTSRHVATEMAQDGMLEPDINAPRNEVVAVAAVAVAEEPKSKVFYGEKYVSGRDGAEIAKLIRADIKAAVRTGELPRGDYSVRIKRSSMSVALRVEVANPAHPVLNVERVMAEKRDPHGIISLPRWAPEMTQTFERLERIARAYQRSESDSHTDYHNTNFFLDVDVSHETERASRAQILAAVEAV